MTKRQIVGLMATGLFVLISSTLAANYDDETLMFGVFLGGLAAGLLPLLTALAVLKLKPKGQCMKLSWCVVFAGLFLQYWFFASIVWGFKPESLLVLFGNIVITIFMLYWYRRKVNLVPNPIDVF